MSLTCELAVPLTVKECNEPDHLELSNKLKTVYWKSKKQTESSLT